MIKMAHETDRTLLIGIPGINGIPSLNWEDIQDANPADYDLVIIDCISLKSSLSSMLALHDNIPSMVTHHLQQLGLRIAKLLDSYGNVVVFCPVNPQVTIQITTQSHGDFDCLEWLPFKFRVVPQTGETLEIGREP